MQGRDLLRRTSKRLLPLPAWIDRLVSVGIVATDPDVVRRQRCVNVAVAAAAATTVSHLIINAIYDFHGLIIIHVYNAFMVAALFLIPRLHRFGANVAAIALGILVLFAHMFVIWAMGITSDLHIYYTSAGALLLLFGVQNWRLFLVFFFLYVAALLFALNFAPVDGILLPEEGSLRDMLSIHAMITTIALNSLVLFYALTTLRRAELELKNQYERSEALVGAVMPAPVAERLKAGEERIADRIETLSVMFADIVDFTGTVHAMPPDEVVAYLDRLVRRFDALSAQFRVEKIKTIGDSYMAAAGFDGRGADGAIAAGRLALAMIEAIAQEPPLGGRKLQMRIGIHSGTATAGVIGDTRFSYDVWGDAVNTASRMESYGVPGRIQVSEAFRALAADAFAFEERGTTDIKGIGATTTYFMVCARAHA